MASTKTVGGQAVPLDKLSIFLSNFWLLIMLIMVIPIAFLLYRNRSTLKFITPLISKFFEFRRMF
ncbi:hypothetical protein A3K80_03175 [Candidatus Bathyarchaeota archaeon RBG_13_38_9]|nr:MAG: hypothetical protein A3K80_03175 [Candidatus Bathyarchaeota archaeon RBG_13_38_9]